jgi:DNA mismatch endonuclease (patch repair protein)
MPDVFTKEKRSNVMSRIRGRGNVSTELRLALLLRTAGFNGWRRHRAIMCEVAGRRFRVKPDFVFVKSRIAIFSDGCFWHRCKQHSSIPANNNAFWEQKLNANIQRDRLVNRALRARGWQVIRIWEHDITSDPPTRLLSKLRKALQSVP